MRPVHTVLLLSVALLIPACLDAAEPDSTTDTEVLDRRPRHVCTPNETWACYDAPIATDYVGVCHRGVKTCNADGSAWGACADEVVPSPEQCNALDDDCDGITDESCTCDPGEVFACYDGPPGTEGVGTCVGGSQACNADGSGASACEGSVAPIKEICGDGLDNDCNGDVDQGCVCFPNEAWVCYSGPQKSDGVGACHRGVQTCADDGFSEGPCLDEVTPTDEVCGNAIDDDCDGDTDEGCQACVPTPEVCGDGLDNDCDGTADEGCVCAPGSTEGCYGGPTGTAGVGVCAAGVATCAADGSGYGACTGAITPSPEVCGNGLDDDCDGSADEGCVCAPGSAAACYDGPAGTSGVGACAPGAMTCNATGTGYGACVGSITPGTEVCGNGIDDDCDGDTDEGCVCAPGAQSACYDGPPGTEGVGVCTDGAQTCNALGTGYGACVGATGPSAEVCGDGLDNDCNGQTDETCVCAPGSQASCYGGPPGTAGVGACAAGTRTCAADGSGYGACTGAVLPTSEVCGDHVDNDCDGFTDEGCIGDRAWNDRDRDGIQDPGEVGVPGAIFLLRSAVTGALLNIQVSDANGTYWFANTPGGSYYIEVVPPVSFGLSSMDAGPDNVDSDFDGEGMNTNPFTLPTNSSIDTIDCGMYSTIGS